MSTLQLVSVNPQVRSKGFAYKEPIVATLQIVAVNPQLHSKGFHAQWSDNPHLEDPHVRFIEETLVAYEHEFGEEGSVTGLINSFERWQRINSGTELEREPMGD